MTEQRNEHSGSNRGGLGSGEEPTMDNLPDRETQHANSSEREGNRHLTIYSGSEMPPGQLLRLARSLKSVDLHSVYIVDLGLSDEHSLYSRFPAGGAWFRIPAAAIRGVRPIAPSNVLDVTKPLVEVTFREGFEALGPVYRQAFEPLRMQGLAQRAFLVGPRDSDQWLNYHQQDLPAGKLQVSLTRTFSTPTRAALDIPELPNVIYLRQGPEYTHKLSNPQSIRFQIQDIDPNSGAWLGSVWNADVENPAPVFGPAGTTTTWTFGGGGQLDFLYNFPEQQPGQAGDSISTWPIPATTSITNTTLNLAQGQVAELSASGRWNIYGDSRSRGPAGSLDAIAHNPSVHGPQYSWPKPGVPEACLLIYINNSIVGYFATDSAVVTGPGLLGFGPNDDYLPDNSGALTVTVTVPSTP